MKLKDPKQHTSLWADEARAKEIMEQKIAEAQELLMSLDNESRQKLVKAVKNLNYCYEEMSLVEFYACGLEKWFGETDDE